MRFQDVVSTVMLHAGKTLPRSNVEVVLRGLSKAVLHELMRSGEFSLPGVGRFVVARRKPRMRRNPRTGEPVMAPAKKVVSIRPFKSLKGALE